MKQSILSGRRTRYSTLLLAILGFMVVGPLLDGTSRQALFSALLSSLVVAAGAFAAADNRPRLLIAALLGLPYFYTLWRGWLGPDTVSPVMVGVSGCLFFGFIVAVILRDILTHRQVLTDTIFGAVCAYVLLADAWGFVYLAVYATDRGAFSLPVEPPAVEMSHFFYFSFTTLTTLGYGDVTPMSHLARNLTSLEATSGVMFVAILVSRLVSSYQPQPRSKG